MLAPLRRVLALLRRVASGRRSDASMVERLRARGIAIGTDCRIYSDLWTTEPYLISIGDRVGIAGGVKILTHDGAAHMRRQHRPDLQFLGPVTVGDDCFIGENAILLPGTTIGAGSIIGAGAVVRGTIPSNSLVAGNPAAVLGRASLFLDRLERSGSALDTFRLPPDERRRVILAHFRKGPPIDAP